MNSYEKALAWVNEQRVIDGQSVLTDLPSGIRQSTTSCPIAKAFAYKEANDGQSTRYPIVTAKALKYYSKEWGGYIEKKLPRRVRKFVQDFDKGIYYGLERI